MKKSIITFALVFFAISLKAEDLNLIKYVPSDGEIQYYMNLYARLQAIDQNKMDYKQLGNMYTNFENTDSRYYSTYQRLLFESYLMQTKNDQVRRYIIEYINTNSINDLFSQSIIRLYKSKPEEYMMDKKKYIRYKYNDDYVDENINLFNMNEVGLFNGELGLMLFTNDWTQIKFADKNDDTVENITLLFGGGTNSTSIVIKKIPKIDYSTFKEQTIDGNFYKEKYKNYQILELKNEGILARAGADHIFLGIGNDKDIAFSNIDNFSSVMYMYSEKKQIGYEIEYFMNISTKNNNYSIRTNLYNHLIFQCLLSFITD